MTYVDDDLFSSDGRAHGHGVAMNTRYPAFEQWLIREAQGNLGTAARILHMLAERGDVVWPYLEATGDEEYSAATFLQAAEMILNQKFNEGEE